MGRRIIYLVCLTLALGAAATLIHRNSGPAEAKYIFINQTDDHRFDESIRASILAATKRTGVENAVFITNGAKEAELEKLASELYLKLNVGKFKNGRGVLYLYSSDTKLLKIEVGYALEDVLPDVLIRGLERAAKSFTFSDRYQDFWAELINTLNIRIAQNRSDSESFDYSNFKFLSGGAGVSARDYQTSPAQLIKEMTTAASPSAYASSSEITRTIDIYLRSLHDGVGDSRLDVLTPESRLFREITPTTNYQLYRNWEMANRAGEEKTFIEGDFAFVFFRTGHPVLPLVLQRKEGRWRVHEPLSWSLFHRFEDSMQVYLKYPLDIQSEDLKRYLRENLGQPLCEVNMLLSPASIMDFAPDSTHALYFRLFWLTRTEERLRTLDLKNAPVLDLWLLADANLNLGKMAAFATVYRAIADRFPQNLTLQKNAEFYKKVFRFADNEWRLSL